MMELSSKSRSIKKKHKKKKIRVPESDLLPVVKPNLRNGDSNWMKLQKIIEPAKKNILKTDTEKNMQKITGINLNSPDHKPPFSQKGNFLPKNFSRDSQDKGIQTRIKYHKKFVAQGKSIRANNVNNSSVSDVSEHSKVTANRGPNQHFEFNFDTSVQHSSVRNESGHEGKRNEIPKGKDDIRLTSAVAMDCEMVGTGPKGDESIIARVSIVNSHGDCLYDEFVKPKERVTDFRTEISGVRPSDLKNGKDLYEVQKDVLNIIEGRKLIGHSIRHDLDVLFISHPSHLIRDTAFYKPFRDICGGRTPSLKKLTSKILGCEIQSGEHSSVEDAQAAMLLYLRQKKEWESLIKSQRKRRPRMIENQTRS